MEFADIYGIQYELIRSLRVHHHSTDQMKILKDQSAQTTAGVVSIASLVATLLDQQSAQLNNVYMCVYVYVYI